MKQTAETLTALQRDAGKRIAAIWGTFDTDWRINKISRAIVRWYHRQFHGCWLGRVNHYASDGDKPFLWRYERGLVRNFETAFVLPCYDAQIEAMLKDRHEAPYEGTGPDGKRVDSLFDRIEKLGGTVLHWV